MGQPMEVQVLSCPQTNEPDAAAFGDYRLGNAGEDLKAGAGHPEQARGRRGGVAEILCNKIISDQVLWESRLP